MFVVGEKPWGRAAGGVSFCLRRGPHCPVLGLNLRVLVP